MWKLLIRKGQIICIIFVFPFVVLIVILFVIIVLVLILCIHFTVAALASFLFCFVLWRQRGGGRTFFRGEKCEKMRAKRAKVCHFYSEIVKFGLLGFFLFCFVLFCFVFFLGGGQFWGKIFFGGWNTPCGTATDVFFFLSFIQRFLWLRFS